MVNILHRTSAFFTLVFLLAAGAWGQKKEPALPQDHPSVYYSFFLFMENFSDWLDTRAQQAPARKVKLMESAARYLKIDANDLPKLAAECRSASAKFKKIEADAHEYWENESKKRKAPDSVILQEFAAKRQAAIDEATAQLRRVLSAASWSGLRGHINGKHRMSIESYR